MTIPLSFEGLVVLIGWPLATLKWFSERFYAVELNEMYGIVTLRHHHPDCGCKGTLNLRVMEFQMVADDLPAIPAFQEIIDESRQYYIELHTAEDHQRG